MKLPLRQNVCMLVYNSQYRLFLGERHGETGLWQLPQGGVEEEESLEENVLRELEEELGAEREKFQIVRQLESKHEYDWDKAPDYAKDKWRGQSQTFWVVKFRGLDSDINLETEHPEFSSFMWATTEEIVQTAESKRVAGYKRPLAEFENLLDRGSLP